VGIIQRRTDGSELRDALIARVIPALARFTDAHDVLRYLQGEEPRVPFLRRQLPRDPDAPLRAVVAWRAAGSPTPSITVTPLDDATVRVEVGRELVAEHPDLVAAFIGEATPFDDARGIREVIVRSPGVFDIVGRRLRPEVMKASYERFLAVRRFGTAPTKTAPIWSFASDDDGELEEVDIEDAEDTGDILVTFSDDVAHEHVDLVEECIARCRTFPGAEEVSWHDREVILIRGPNLDRDRLQKELLAFVRRAVAKREAADHEDDG
jgi:hypothetical protein